jgi:SAM-dependent methyltransferase
MFHSLPRVVGWSGFAHIPFNMYSEREENPSGRFMSAITQIPEKAPRNAALCGFTNIEIIEADIAELPLQGTCADVDGSINLSPQKLCVLEEGFHVLEPGGWLYIADMVRDTSTEDSSCGCEQFSFWPTSRHDCQEAPHRSLQY